MERTRTGALRPTWLLAAMLAVIGSLATGCSAPARLTEQQLYAQANAEFEAGNFNVASLHYDELLEQHPFSDLAEEARLRVAHAHFLNGAYEKAIAAFNDFERLHPTSPQLPFVEYTIAMSHLDQSRARDRDKSASENALRQFERVRDRYAGSLYGRLAEFRIQQCRENLARHELYIGDYYVKVGREEAGQARYRFILEQFPDTDVAEQARERLATGDG